MTYTQPTIDESGLYNALRELFSDDMVAEIAIRPRDFLKWVPKDTSSFGAGASHVLDVSIGQGIGATLEQAQANATADDYYKFLLEPNDYYGSTMLKRKAMMRTAGGGSIFDEKKRQITRRIKLILEAIERQCWGDGTGSLGAIGTITSVANSVVTLANPKNIIKLKKGMCLAAYNGAAARTDTLGRIATINHSDGTFTMDANKVSAGTWTAGDTLYIGKFGATGGAAGADDKQGNILNGLEAWAPATYETSGTFLGMNRTIEPLPTQGFRGEFRGSIETSAKQLAAQMNTYGAEFDAYWCSSTNWTRLETELGSRVVREDGNAETFGIPSIRMSAGGRTVPVMGASFCPDNVGWLMHRECLELLHLGELPHLAPTPASHHSIDAKEVRVAAFAELKVKRPLDLGRHPING